MVKEEGETLQEAVQKVFERVGKLDKNQGLDEGAPRVPDAHKLGENGSKSASPIAFRQSLRAMGRMHAGCQGNRCAADRIEESQLLGNRTFSERRKNMGRDKCRRAPLSDRIGAICSDIGTKPDRECISGESVIRRARWREKACVPDCWFFPGL